MTATSSHPTHHVARAHADINPVREFLTFQLGGVSYGIDILKVQEIRGYETPTRISNTPAYVKGVLNLRGVIVPILDLRLKLAMEHANFDALTVTVVLNLEQRVTGVVVDAVSDVIELKAEQIMPAPDFNHGVDASFITGICDVGTSEQQRMLVLLDIERLMAPTHLNMASQTLQ